MKENDSGDIRVDVVFPKTLPYTEMIEDIAAEYAKTKASVKREIRIGEKWYSFEMLALAYNGVIDGYQLFVRDIQL